MALIKDFLMHTATDEAYKRQVGTGGVRSRQPGTDMNIKDRLVLLCFIQGSLSLTDATEGILVSVACSK